MSVLWGKLGVVQTGSSESERRFWVCASDTAYNLLRASLAFYRNNSALKTSCRCWVFSPNHKCSFILGYFLPSKWIQLGQWPKIKIPLADFFSGNVHLALWFIAKHTGIIPLTKSYFFFFHSNTPVLFEIPC